MSFKQKNDASLPPIPPSSGSRTGSRPSSAGLDGETLPAITGQGSSKNLRKSDSLISDNARTDENTENGDPVALIHNNSRPPSGRRNSRRGSGSHKDKGTDKEPKDAEDDEDEDEGDDAGPEGHISAAALAAGNGSAESKTEDPEAEYYRSRKTVPKNKKAVASELKKRMQASAATKKLDVGELELTVLPDKIFETEDLKVLWAQNNQIEVLPRAVGRTKQLTQLRLFGNQLRWLPFEIGECVNLQVLWLQDNKLIALPGSIGNMTQLKILALARNPLRSLPADIHKCSALKEVDTDGLDEFLSIPPVDVIRQGLQGAFIYLKEYQRRLSWVSETAMLDLSSMGITAPTLPLEVTNMTEVTALNLARNQMNALSSSINYMASLTDLDVSDCPMLKQLSPEMGAMKQLTRIGTTGTELSSPPPEVVAMSAAAIIEYLATLHDARTTHTLHLNNLEVQTIDDAVSNIEGLTHLSFASNRLREVSRALGKLIFLQTLELQTNDIRVLPRDLEHCTALTHVDISDNRLEGPLFADLWVGAWTKMRYLNIKSNEKITMLPMALATWTSLEKLDLDYTLFTQPPIEVLKKGAKPTVSYCSKFADTEGTVARLELSGYAFKAYPLEINQLKGLRSLMLQYNEIKVLPDDITILKDLRELHMSHNPLVTVPPILATFTNMRALRLDNTLLDELPAFLGLLGKLKSLSAVQNRVVSIPEDFGNMASLTKLNLDSNGLRSLPESIGKMTALKDLSLTRNKIGWLPTTLGKLNLVEELRLSFNRLWNLPKEIGFMTSLVRLRCGNNMIQEIPLEFEKLTRMEDLSINSNQISIIPLVIGNLMNLKSINYDNNPIKSPREDVLAQGSDSLILYFQKLYTSALKKGLDMCHSNLRHFPSETLTVPSLNSLVIDDNQLEELPPELMVLTSLTLLSIQRNRLSKIPYECGMLTSLARLLLNDNQLTEIPLSIGRAKGLLDVDLQNNGKWVTPPMDVVDQGSAVIVNYLHKFGDAFETGQLKLEAMKLVDFPADAFRYPYHYVPLEPPPLTLLSVAHNKISEVSPEIHLLTALQELNLDENDLELLPEAVRQLTSLTKLSFSTNFFNTFPNEVTSCWKLQSLQLTGNPLISIDAGVGNLTLLKELLVDHDKIEEPAPEVVAQGCAAIVRYLGQINVALQSYQLHLPNFKLVTFPPEMVDSPSHPVRQAALLTLVSLPGNRLETVPTCMASLTSLTKLDLSDNKLKKMSVVMGAWHRLKYMDLSGNLLEDLPSTIGNLRRIQVLSLANNKLTVLPPYMNRLVQLQELYVQKNQLQELFEGIEKCTALNRLVISDNKFPCLPYELARITTLKSILLDANPLTSPPPEIRDISTEAILKYLGKFDESSQTHSLDLDNMNLKVFPLEVIALSGLRTLSLKGNQIEVIPPLISEVAGLESMHIDHNKILQLPAELGAVYTLRELTFDGNELRTPPLEILEQGTSQILEYLKRMLNSRKTQQLDLRCLELRRTPVEVAFMTGLTSLSLENNHLQKVFVGIGQLTLLVELLLDYNELQTLPRTVANLTNLTKLSIAHNKVKHLADWMHALTPLRSLNACDNLLQELPFSLLRFTNLTHLNVDMNSFPDPPREVVVAGQRQIFKYLSMLQVSQKTNKLDFSNLGLLHFPVLHCQMTSMTELNLDYNFLEALPKEIGNLLKMEKMSLRENKLTHLPLEMGFLKRLKECHTLGNDMITPPQEVCKLGATAMVSFLSNVYHAEETKAMALNNMNIENLPAIVLDHRDLTKLDLSHNAMTIIPDSILGLTCLLELFMDDNKITEIPKDIGLLRGLTKLSLRKNKLTKLPESIGDMQLLKALYVEENMLKELPPELGIAYALEDVRVRDNPLKIPPPEVVSKGTRHFLDYLRRIVDLQRNQVCDLAHMGMQDPELPEYILKQRFVSQLILEDNLLEDLDESVTRLTALSVVNFDKNRLQKIPDCIFYLTTVTSLRVCENDLADVGPGITRLVNLKSLYFNNNPNLEFIAPAIGLLTGVEILELSRCPLRGPPVEVVNAGAKATLDYQRRIQEAQGSGELFLEGFELLSSNRDKMDVHVKQISNLTTLSMSQNRLQEVDPELGTMLTQLKELYLRSNFIRELPVELANLLRLTVLHLDQNELRQIDPWIRFLTSLVDLSISQNQLEFLTEAIGELKNLKKLNLTSNKLLSLPPELCLATSMVSLNVENNPLRSPPREVCDQGMGLVVDYLRRLYVCMTSNHLHLGSMGLLHFPIEAQVYTSLTGIDLGDNLIKELPRAIGNHPNLENLSIAHNQLEKLHNNIQHLVHLQKLHLPFNNLTSLPEVLSNLRGLQILNVIENHMTGIEDHVCKITTLTDLRFSHNKLTEVSRFCSLLVNLKRLNIDQNELAVLPEELGGMAELTYMDLSFNKFESLPESFRYITKLTALNVSNNSIRMLPTGIGQCKNLDNFLYDENPLNAVPPEVYNHNSATLIDYLGRLFRAGPPPGCENLPGAWEGKTKILILDGLRLDHMPPYVYGLGYLEELSAARNSITELPPEISLLRKLKKLNMESNLLKTLPLELCLCPLEDLMISLNNLEEPPEDVREHGCRVVQQYLKAQYHAKKVGVLDIRDCFLTALPAEIQRLAGPNLHTIDMSDNLMPQLPNLKDLCYTRDLRVGQNRLTMLPDSVRLLTAVTTLHLPNNLLSALPMTFAFMTSLQTLNLEGNKFPNVPAVVCRVTSLTDLNVSNNRIPVLDAEIGQLKQLRKLRASNNGLQVVADELCDASELRLIDLSNNNMEMLPGYICTEGHIEKLSNLESLDVRGNLLSVLPSGLGLLSSTLTDLKYDDFELSQLPSEVLEEGTEALLHYLVVCQETIHNKCLDLTGMGFQTVPRHIGEMVHLEELRLSHNHIVDLPEWIGSLKALKVLRLDQTGIRTLPFGLCDCASLQTLDLDGLSLLSPPKQILAKGVTIIKEWLGRLREARGGGRLDLSSLGLEDWPSELSRNAAEGQYNSLKRLNLLDNILTELPIEVCDLSTLSELTAGYNRMTSIHVSIGELSYLERIHLPFNKLSELPDTVTSLSALKFVNLDGNEFKDLPHCLCFATELRELRMNQNQLASLPAPMANLANLEDLQLNYNELIGLPRSIGYNTAITRLKVSYNSLTSVPSEIGLLKKLKDFQLTHNKLEALPAELGALLPSDGSLTELGLSANYFKAPLSQIILRGTPATLRFLREQI